MTRAFIGLGSNLGDRLANIRLGISAFGEEVVAVSPIYETAPVGGPEQDDYLNAVIELNTLRTPRQLLERAMSAEQAAGRIRVVQNGPRTLDVDILLVDGLTVAEADLTVPHPRMYERRFVLAPLGDLAPELIEPAMLDEAVGEVRLLDSVVVR